MTVKETDRMQPGVKSNGRRNFAAVVIEIVVDHMGFMQPHLRARIGLKRKCISAVRRNGNKAFETYSGIVFPSQNSQIQTSGLSGRKWAEGIEVRNPRPGALINGIIQRAICFTIDNSGRNQFAVIRPRRFGIRPVVPLWS